MEEYKIDQKNNAAYYFIDRHLDTKIENKKVFFEATSIGRSISYKDLSIQTNKMIDLLSKLNVRREERVLMLVLDQIEFPIIFWGCIKSGVIPVPINTLLSKDIIKTILDDCRAKTIFVSQEIKDLIFDIPDLYNQIDNIFVIGKSDNNKDVKNFTTELDLCVEKEIIKVSGDEPAFWLYSSGSTGEPKGAIHVHKSLLETFETYAVKVLKIKEKDIVFSVAKLFFAYGLGNAMTFPMGIGATTALFPLRPTPDSVNDIMNKIKPTILFAVPTIYAAMLVNLRKENNTNFENLRICVSAGEALPSQIGQDWKSITGVDILDGVGSTEMLHIFLSNKPDDIVYGTSGSAVPGYKLRLVNEKNEEVHVGEIGELLVKGKSSAIAYWNKLTKSRKTFEGEWTRTGDKYEKLEEGKFIYSGRTDDMFKVSGIWISPFEVEQALVSHEIVLEAAVVAKQDNEGLDKPCAFVILNENVTKSNKENILKEHVKNKIGKWKYPRWINFVDDLPKTATGKVQRFKLR
ncbi:MAG: 4-hydroxybenzoate--CoA ligase [Gammaproteobacteria bacterium TMED180]|nr:MAG: 4-hydroxybenzoate--CoA ligase [Gammaproteobacteria bacterium TMED180]|tara:strand:- start:1160 stop:2713 length:1554 start_codon:yes stop_codon:yes gene_type:complete